MTSASSSAPSQAVSVTPADSKLPTPYSAAQLATLDTTYDFHWNAAAYFVIVFSGIVVAAFSMVILYILMRAWAFKRQNGSVGVGESYLVGSEGGRKPRPTSKVLDALRGRKISTPIPSEEHTDGHIRESGGTVVNYGSGHDDAVAHGW